MDFTDIKRALKEAGIVMLAVFVTIVSLKLYFYATEHSSSRRVERVEPSNTVKDDKKSTGVSFDKGKSPPIIKKH